MNKGIELGKKIWSYSKIYRYIRFYSSGKRLTRSCVCVWVGGNHRQTKLEVTSAAFVHGILTLKCDIECQEFQILFYIFHQRFYFSCYAVYLAIE